MPSILLPGTCLRRLGPLLTFLSKSSAKTHIGIVEYLALRQLFQRKKRVSKRPVNGISCSVIILSNSNRCACRPCPCDRMGYCLGRAQTGHQRPGTGSHRPRSVGLVPCPKVTPAPVQQYWTVVPYVHRIS